MGLQPKMRPRNSSFVFKKCSRCGESYGPESYAPSRSFFFDDGVVPLCDYCVNKFLEDSSGEESPTGAWDKVNKICQWADIPFDPNQWEKIKELNPNNTFHKYAEVFCEEQYDDIGWQDYYEKFKRLKEVGKIENELPGLSDSQRRKYRQRWGAYDDDGYRYLEDLYSGLMQTQSVNGALQTDQAIKICKISYEIDKRIEEGGDFDKLLGSYDKLVKAAEFTPKNVKNANDFESIGEIFKWMEKRGWKNGFYDGDTRDIVDETIKSMQNFNQRLYTQEVNIGDEISRRIEALKTANEIENNGYYGTDKIETGNYDNDMYNDLFDEEEEFSLEEDE